MKIERDQVVMSTGRTFYANRGIIGLGPDLDVSYGYDGSFPAWPRSWVGECMTEEERQELAAYMIEAWKAFAMASGPIPEEDYSPSGSSE